MAPCVPLLVFIHGCVSLVHAHFDPGDGSFTSTFEQFRAGLAPFDAMSMMDFGCFGALVTSMLCVFMRKLHHVCHCWVAFACFRSLVCSILHPAEVDIWCNIVVALD